MFGARLFPGGIHPREGLNGKAENSGNPIQELPAVSRVIIPLSQHIGAPATATVKKGDHVLMGQVIGEAAGFVSAPVHASVSGTVVEVGNCKLASGATVPAVTIDNDFQDEWVELHPSEHPENLTAEEAQQIIRNAGIVGMGGATFPTQVKLTPGAGKSIEKLIINGAECEPYLTADHRLMLEHTGEIVGGVRRLMLAFGVKEAVIGVEDNKKDAISALTDACSGVEGLQVQALPVRYPQGGEKQLIYAITKREVPVGGLPIDVGCVVLNVGTVFACDQAIRMGIPLVRRVTTVGGLVNNPGNFLVRIGTPVKALFEACGGTLPSCKQLISGGPMMGISFKDTDCPVTKGTSGILALGKESIYPEETSCIRCARCLDACPMRLAPSRMDSYIRHERYDDAEKAGVMNCIECGACTYVCPAKRLLTQSFRMGKKVINTRKKAAAAKAAAEKAQLAAEKAANEKEKKEA